MFHVIPVNKNRSCTYRSPLMRCLFRCGLLPGVPSRCWRLISLLKAWSTASAFSSDVRILERPWRE